MLGQDGPKIEKKSKKNRKQKKIKKIAQKKTCGGTIRIAEMRGGGPSNTTIQASQEPTVGPPTLQTCQRHGGGYISIYIYR